MRISLLLFFVLLFGVIQAQNTSVSPALRQMQESAQPLTKVEVLLKLEHVGVPSWCVSAGEVKEYLQNQTTKIQGELLARADQQGLYYRVVDRLWIANVLVLELYVVEFDQWKKYGEVESMELAAEQQAVFVEPVMMQDAQRAPGGTENGLEVVGARFLWEKGYSGRGQKVLNFDTGIWPDHPAFGDRFLGNHQSMDASWKKFYRSRPGDRSGSHGTHTNGTCVGLDTATNDTIGFAFNAYFLATDPIVDNIADIRSMWEISKGYEWAIDPDGDPSTDDAPDVINNSWGHTFDPQNDSVICNGFFKDVLEAVEAAGIVSVQSAGNSGPGSGTVGSPAGGISSLVNNFSVGAVNGHNASYPIASFSSRGPSHCPDTGVIIIKPEVVAPGVNVRSAVRNGNGVYAYGNYQGTSMAGPHAAGLALLLMEAFPEASAVEIKEAMYYSAIDLGDPGEENTYGRGLINAEGAFNYLDSLYTPATPNQSTTDFYIIDLLHNEGDYSCGTEISLQVVLGSLGGQADLPATAQLMYGVIGLDSFSMPLGDYNHGDTIATPTWQTASSGYTEFFARIESGADSIELDIINNQRVSRSTLLPLKHLPYFEGFEQIDVFRNDFYVDDPDVNYPWDTTSVPNYWQGSKALRIPLARYTPRRNQEDALITPQLNLPMSSQLYLAYDYSYQTKFVGFDDSLEVAVSNDCGATWTTLMVRTTETLNTTDTTAFSSWVPFGPSDWGHDTLSLSAYAGSPVLLKFIAHNQGGNNLYLDNIRVWEGEWLGLQDIEDGELKVNVFPNPTRDVIRVDDDYLRRAYQAVDITGRTVLEGRYNGSIDCSRLPNGTYVLILREEEKVSSGRFQILR